MDELKLGIAGLGHVGCGLISLLNDQDELRLPGNVKIAGVCARSKTQKRSVDVSIFPWFDNSLDLATHPEIDVFVELMGGTGKHVRKAIEAALELKKPVVTANKALIAEYGSHFVHYARQNEVDLMFEAAVAGGIPIVRAVRDSLTGVRIERVVGILNGTCNYLTSTMLASERDYEDVLAEAQELGYAEADPTFDVSGLDAAHKGAILAAMAFSAEIDFTKVSVRGVEHISLLDLKLAKKLGYTIKLVVESYLTNEGVVCRVNPKALPNEHELANVNGSLNVVRVEGSPVGAVTFSGPGAGGGPTASAVLGDIAKLFTPTKSHPFGQATHHRVRKFVNEHENSQYRFYLRIKLKDTPGALAEVTEALAEQGVSVDQLIQEGANKNGESPVAIITHASPKQSIEKAIDQIAKIPVCIKQPRQILVEK